MTIEYALEGGPYSFNEQSYIFGFESALEHSYLYCENSTSVNVGDPAMRGTVSGFKTVMGRKAIIIAYTRGVQEDPEDTYMSEAYYDVASGLFLGSESFSDFPTAGWPRTSTRTSIILSQTVLDMTAPAIDHPNDLAFKEGGSDRQITWHPFDAYPAGYNITQDGKLVDAGSWDGSAITIDVSTLNFGVYEFICSVTDETGQSVQDSVKVSVQGIASETTSKPTTTTIILPPTSETTRETIQPQVTVTEKETVTKEPEDGGFIPSFTLFPTLLGLASLLWFSRRRTK